MPGLAKGLTSEQAWIRRRMEEIAADLSRRLLPPGLHFEWAADES